MKTELRHKSIWQYILMMRKNEMKKALKNDNTTATFLYAQRVGGWYKIKLNTDTDIPLGYGLQKYEPYYVYIRFKIKVMK